MGNKIFLIVFTGELFSVGLTMLKALLLLHTTSILVDRLLTLDVLINISKLFRPLVVSMRGLKRRHVLEFH